MINILLLKPYLVIDKPLNRFPITTSARITQVSFERISRIRTQAHHPLHILLYLLSSPKPIPADQSLRGSMSRRGNDISHALFTTAGLELG